MWYVLRFEHAYGLKPCNDRRMTRGQTTCSLGQFFYLISFLQVLLTFSENDFSFYYSKSSVKALAVFLFLAIKSTLITVPCNENVPCLLLQQLTTRSDATFRLLMSGDINPNPGPVSASTAGKINCLVMNARSLKSFHKDSTTNWQSVCNLHRFQDLVYAENADVICVNETWLNLNNSNSEMLHSGFTIF